MTALTPLILLVASLQSAQDFDQKVTFTGKAMSIQSAIALLAKQTGVPLEPSGSLPEWHIYLQCKDQPLKDLMEKLGDTVYAEWVADQGKYFLRTSSKKLNVARQAQITLNATKLKKEIDKRLKDAATAPPMTRERAEEIAKKMREFQTDNEGRDWKEYAKLQALDPSKSFTWQLISRCNLREIAALKPGERIVFSLNPTPLQKPLDRAFVASRLSTFQRDFVEWSLASQREDESPDQDADQTKAMQEYRLQEEQKLRSFQCSELLLAVSYDKDNPSYRISLGMFDAKGNRAGNSFDQEYFSLANDGEAQQDDMLKQAAPKEGEKKLELSQEEKDFGKMLMGAFDFGGRGEPKPPIKPEWRQRMLNPDKFEPLSFGMSEVMDAYTAENGGQTLMVMPDIMVFMSGFAEIPGGPGDKISATGLIRSMQGFLGLNQQKSGNWMIVNSVDVDSVLWGNRSRKDLTKFFSSLSNPSTADEAWQEYSAQLEGMPFYDMGYLYGAVLMGQSPDMGMSGQNSMAPIYYALTKDQRNQLRNGVPIAVGGLTPPQKEKVRVLTYGAKSLYKCMTPEVAESYAKMNSEQEAQNSEYMYQNGGNGLYIQNLREEPTFSLPTGLPDRAVIVARPISKQVVSVFDNPEGTGYAYDQDTYSIAWDLFQHERPELFPGENNRKLSFYRLGQKQVLHMRVDFDKTRALYGSVELKATGTKEKPVPFDKLPDAVKKEALEQVKQYRESYKDAKPGQFGGGRGSIPKP